MTESGLIDRYVMTESTEENLVLTDNDWLTIKEVSRITGKSLNAITLHVNRKNFDRIKKLKGKWFIHKDSIINLSKQTCQAESDRIKNQSRQVCHDGQAIMIPLEHYDKKHNEWQTERDRLNTGLMMYRYKFEDMERKLKLLPAPIETISLKIEELEKTLQAEQQTRKKLEADLQKVETDLNIEKKKSWWAKLWEI